MTDTRGIFITLEGGEGAGKSTQLSRIGRWLETRGYTVHLGRQPGGTALSEQVRALVKDGQNDGMSDLSELLLLFADRAQFVDEVLRPSLASGVCVVCDRFTDSTYAYQGGGRGVDPARIAALEELVHGDLQPDITLLLDVDIETGLARASQRGAADRFEREDHAFFERVRATYLARAASEPKRFERVDAGGTPDEVWQEIRLILERRVNP